MDRPKISFLSRLIDIIAPRQCPVCGQRLAIGETLLCTRCNLHLPRTHFELTPYDNRMARMFWGRVRIEKCTAWFYYASGSRPTNVILDLKYHKLPDYGVMLGELIAKDIADSGFFDGITALMPLPLAANRKWSRGYNQSRKIVDGLSSVTRLPIIDGAVRRKKYIDSQTHKSVEDRKENVRGVFVLANGKPLENQHVLLVDDVMTTGATLTECISEMEKVPDLKVSVLTVGLAGVR